MNRLFQNAFPVESSAVHIESRREEWGRIFATCRFVSGHALYNTVLPHLQEYGFRQMVVLRDPYAQLASHIAWVRNLTTPEKANEFNRAHPSIQQCAMRLLETNLSDPESIQEWVRSFTKTETAFFDNCQCRYLSGVDGGDLPSAVDAMKSFDHVGLAENLADAIDRAGRAFALSLDAPIVENAQPVRFGLDMENAATRSALADLVSKDIVLYEAAINDLH